jgi:single-strand DNA-binding protein
MSRYMNRVMLRGNVGADPEIRRTKDGRPIANLRLATTESWKDKQSGEWNDKTEWHTIVIFTEGLAKLCEERVRKGAFIAIEGALTTRKWQDNSGQDRYSTEVILQGYNCALDLLDKQPSNRPPAGEADDYGYDGDRAAGRPTGGQSNSRQSNTASSSPSFSRDTDDDIPF